MSDETPPMTEGLPEDVEYEFSLSPDPDESLGQYVLHFQGRVRGWDEGALAERQIGEIKGYRLDLASARTDGLEHAALLERVSSEIADFSEVVLHERDCVLPASEEHSVGEEECGCIVYISEIRVDADFRSRGLGSALLRRVPSMIDTTDCLIALKAFPLTDESKQPPTQEEAARVRHFYEKHGFIPVGGKFMAKDARLCEAIRKRLAGYKAANKA